MNAKINKSLNAAKQWIGLLGVPALIIGLVIAGVIVIAREFDSPIPLDTAISQDLREIQNEEAGAPAPAAPSEQSQTPH